ncbi:unnamed protein product [Dracunculus medinensis]|uniref:Elongation factor Ts n=1 Tax=Dracunculus medinensis TaxID=318479 RepID=A0A0N4UEI5_DRAME|nr:unnamed protein product [Dracunculus medinensis]
MAEEYEAVGPVIAGISYPKVGSVQILVLSKYKYYDHSIIEESAQEVMSGAPPIVEVEQQDVAEVCKLFNA